MNDEIYEKEQLCNIQLCIIDLLNQIGVFAGELVVVGSSTVGTDADGMMPADQAFRCAYYSETSEFIQVQDTREPPAAVLIPDLSAITAVETVLPRLHSLCERFKIPLLVCAPNLASKKNVYALLAGRSVPRNVLAGYTQQSLEKVLHQMKFQQLRARDYRRDSISAGGYELGFLQFGGSQVRKYLDWLKNSLDDCGNTVVFVRAYIPTAVSFEASARDEMMPETPFLSVLTRTQGTRIAELRELLLCLAAQTCSDFEVLLVGHKVRPEDKAHIEQLVEDTPKGLRDRIRYLPLDTGNRSAPLNFGFEKARGAYVSILDDDDLVSADWVETFYDLQKTNVGSILHTYSVVQGWERDALSGVVRSTARPSTEYCLPFDALQQLHINKCPTMSLAYPSWLFDELHIRFDETLDTNEDWDFLMRSVFIAGIAECERVTSVYRKWGDVGSSHQLHTNAEWADTMHAIQRKWNRAPVLFPAGSAKRLEEYYRVYYYAAQERIIPRHQAILFGDSGNGFCADHSYRAHNMADLPTFYFLYAVGPEDVYSNLLRFDPLEKGGFSIDGFSALLVSAAGAEVKVLQQECTTNGREIADSWVYLMDDPQIYIPVPVGFVPCEVILTGNIHAPIPEVLLASVQGNLRQQAILFGDDGNGAREETAYRNENTSFGKDFCIPYNIQPAHLAAGFLRFDPLDTGPLAVENFLATFTMGGDGEVVRGAEQCGCNGFVVQQQFVFMGDDPQIYIPVPEGFTGTEVTLRGIIQTPVPDRLVQEVLLPLEHRAKLFILGPDRTDGELLYAMNQGTNACFCYSYGLPSAGAPSEQLRFEPTQHGGTMLENFTATGTTREGETIALPLNNLTSNGYWTQNGWVFLKSAPKILIPILEGVRLQKIAVCGTLVSPIPDDAMDLVTALLQEESTSKKAVLYVDMGEGYTEQASLRVASEVPAPLFQYTYSLAALQTLAGMLRFDPAEKTGMEIDDFLVVLTGAGGETVPIDLGQCRSNGVRLGEKLVFLKNDPQIWIPVPDKFRVHTVAIRGRIADPIPDTTVDALMREPLYRRIARKIKRMVGG